MSRLQMMRKAVLDAQNAEHADHGPIKGILVGRGFPELNAHLLLALEIIARPYCDLDPTFFADADTTWTSISASPQQADLKPSALIFANARGSQYVPLNWSERAVIFGCEQQKRPPVVVPLGAPDAGERLVSAMEKITTAFFDRHQPT